MKASSHFCHENDDFYARIISETGPRAQISLQVWCATLKGPPFAKAVKGLEPDDRNRFGVLLELGPALASVEFISAERTTESYPKQEFIVLVLSIAALVLVTPCYRSLDSISSTSTVSLSTSTASSSAY